MSSRGILGVVACAGGGVHRRLRPEVVVPAVDRGWSVVVTLTPAAAQWFADGDELSALTRLAPVRSAARLPHEPKPHPMPDAFVVVPCTANSVAKLALGIGDNQALTSLGEALGARVPMVLRPQADSRQRNHPLWDQHLNTLTTAGIRICPPVPDTPWTDLLDELDSVLEERS